MPHLPPPPALQGLTVFERGWLSSNNVLLHGLGDGAVLVDSSHTLHAGQTVALVDHALAGEALRQLVNTHLHSDHCGGNAAVQRRWGCRIDIPPGDYAAVCTWDEDALSYRSTGQTCERFSPDGRIEPGHMLQVGTRRWQALAAPGHDPHSLVLFDAGQGVLISADALWENGFGLVFPELDGERAFDDVGQTLDLIESLDARWVIPGHGAPFADVADALQRARRRLDGFKADPVRHARHAIRVLVKFHLLEVQRQPLQGFRQWFESTPLCAAIWQGLGRPEDTLADFGERTVHELVRSGALALQDGQVLDA
jgi:glyoxylase-like metal-dependent hydrolase (beta-lactamase superfamily II)